MFNVILKWPILVGMSIFGLLSTILLTVLNSNLSELVFVFYDNFNTSPYVIGGVVGLVFIISTFYFEKSLKNLYGKENVSLKSKAQAQIIGAGFVFCIALLMLTTVTIYTSVKKDKKRLITDFYNTYCDSQNPIRKIRSSNIKANLNSAYATNDYIIMNTILNVSSYLTDKAVDLSEKSLNERILNDCKKLHVEI